MYLHQQSPLTWTFPLDLEGCVSMETHSWSHRRFLNCDSAIKMVTFPNGYISISQRLWLFNLNLLWWTVVRSELFHLPLQFQKMLWSLRHKTACTTFTPPYVITFSETGDGLWIWWCSGLSCCFCELILWFHTYARMLIKVSGYTNP